MFGIVLLKILSNLVVSSVTLVHDVGENLIVPGAVELYPTYTAVGIELPYTGDVNENAEAQFVWRKEGESNWRDGVDMTIDRKNRFIWASIWPLQPGQAVEVRVTISDPEPLQSSTVHQVTTRKLVLESNGDRTLYVSPSGSDRNPGSIDAPFATLEHAQGQLRPGDTLVLASGIYREGNLFRYSKGRPDRPIVITAAEGAAPVLDSSFEISKGFDQWRKHAGDVFVTSLDVGDEGGQYLAQDGNRCFHYDTLERLVADPSNVRRGWHYDKMGKKLYVRTGLGGSPKEHLYHVSRHQYGVYLEGSKHVVVRGLTIRNFGDACVRISGNADGNVLYGNTLHNSQCAVFLKDASTANNAIWKNHVYEPGLWDFSWNAIKKSDYGRQGIMVWNAGRGNSICFNTIHGWFDGVNVEAWNKGEQFELNRDSDTMFNVIYNIGDDAIENDGGGVNMRVHRNRIRNAHTALSFAPIERGPVYITRNDMTYHTLMFKLSVSTPSPGHGYFYHNSGYTIDNSNIATMIRMNVYEVEDQNKVFLNNAMIGSEYSIHRGRPNNIFDGNCYHHTPSVAAFRKFDWQNESYNTFDTFRTASGQESNGIYADPQFLSTPDLGARSLENVPLYRDATLGDLRLRTGSPCIDKAVRIRGFNDSFTGQGPDIGAHESTPLVP